MSSRRKLLLVPVGYLIILLLIGMGTLMGSHTGLGAQEGDEVHIDVYPVGPEKPTPLNSSNVVDYTVTYEERLFYNDLLASHNYSFGSDERVIANCTTISVSNGSTDEFHVQLECRGGVTDSSQLAGSEEFTYSVTYRITNNTTQQAGFQKYPFGTDRTFNNERD